jgi:hypothetical protein
MMHRSEGHAATGARTLSDMPEPIPDVLCIEIEADEIDVAEIRS